MSDDNLIKHIRHTHADRDGEAWCGAKVSSVDWTFADIDHAAYNGMNGGRLLSCKKCVEAVIDALKQGGAP